MPRAHTITSARPAGRRLSLRFVACSLALLAVNAACGGGANTPTAPTVQGPPAVTATGLAVSATARVLLTGRTARLSATATLSDGTTRAVTPTWSSGASSIVLVDSSGTVTAIGTGSATITATAEGRTATVDVRGIPDWSGNWLAEYDHVTCTVPPRWGASYCNVFNPQSVDIRIQHGTDDALSATVDRFGWTGTFSGRINVNGSVTLAGRLSRVVGNNLTQFHDDAWTIQLTTGRGFTGTTTETITWPGEGQGTATGQVTRATKR